MTGYLKLAQFMSNKNYAIFKQFHHLAIRDLLYLQAELVHLDHEYELAAEADRDLGGQNQDERQYYSRGWWYLSNSEGRGYGGEQWKIALEIRSKLREYCLLPFYILVMGCGPSKGLICMSSKTLRCAGAWR
jgi:hypothetical protein